MKYSLERISALTGARLYGDEKYEIRWLLTDSRSLCFPEETLFFALESQRNDGHRYIDELYRRGVRAFVVRLLPQQWSVDYKEAAFLQTASPLMTLQRLAERHREQYNVPVVGITGSNGKTIVKEWLYQVMAPDYIVDRSPRSYNSQIGVPLSVWAMNERTEVALFEAGISQKGEMAALQTVVQPTIGIFTSLGEAHQEHFSSLEEKCLEKMRLFADSRQLVYGIDDNLVASCVEKSGIRAERITWSRHNKNAVMYVESTENMNGGTKVTYLYKGVRHFYHIPFEGEAAEVNSFCCALCALTIGIDSERLAESMSRLEPIAMRLDVLEGRNGCIMINDSYNADYNSLAIALDFMNRRTDQKFMKKTLVLSDMVQTGQVSHVFYTRVAQLVHQRGIEKLIAVGPELKAAASAFNMECHFFDTTEAFLQSNVIDNLHRELVLIKGARMFRFDKVTDYLRAKVHDTTLDVNLNALVDNLNYYRRFLNKTTKVVCMVKASAYGAGAVEIAKTLQEHRVDYLAVAVADEGVELRKAGVTSNIIVMNPEMNSFRTLFEYELEPEVYSFRLLDALVYEAQKEGVTQFPIHIKIDTGMHRLGFNPQKDMEALMGRLLNQSAVIPRSVFSHFVGSDSDDFDEFTALQYETFQTAADTLQSAYQHKLLRHICNSAGVEHFSKYQLDMVRLGLGLYGVSPYGNRILHHVSTLKTTILQIHDVVAGDTVGYSRKTRLNRDSRIASLPIGYADGLNRRLGNNNGYCLVNGCKAPYVGNICMDVCMVDVTDVECNEGDTAIIFGEDLPVVVLSDAIGTIPYEVLTGVSNRVKRVYYQD